MAFKPRFVVFPFLRLYCPQCFLEVTHACFCVVLKVDSPPFPFFYFGQFGGHHLFGRNQRFLAVRMSELPVVTVGRIFEVLDSTCKDSDCRVRNFVELMDLGIRKFRCSLRLHRLFFNKLHTASARRLDISCVRIELLPQMQ